MEQSYDINWDDLDNYNEYWDKYYHDNQTTNVPSDFAKFCTQLLAKNSFLLDVGCGNGRDSIFFSSQGHRVVACDRSHEALSSIQGLKNIMPLNCDIAKLSQEMAYGNFDAIYSRFSLHSVNLQVENIFLEWAYDHLTSKGQLMIECRSVNDNLYGEGLKVEKDAYVIDHYRRFIRSNELLTKLRNLGFYISYFAESNGFAVQKDDDPVVIRVVAAK